MAPEAFLDSKYQFSFSSRVLNQVAEGTMQPSSSVSLLQKDGQYQAVVASLLNTSSGNLQCSAAKIAQMDEGMVSGVTNPRIVQETANFILSSFRSLLPDANIAVSRGRQLQRSASANLHSYLNLLPLPVFSSHSLISSGSSVADDSSTMQQTCQFALNSSQARKRKQQQRGFTAISSTDLQRHQSLSLNGVKLDLCTSSEVHKKPRLDILQPRLQNEMQQNVLQSTPQAGQVNIEKLQQQQRMRQHQLVHQVPAAYALHSGVCSRRIMQYMYHLRHRPSDNDIAYWRKFVAEYYAPSAKKRWCLSSYDNVGFNALGVFPKDAWQCDLCGSKSGRGFEANLEALPRLNKIVFESGVIDELLYLDLPHERVQFCGLMMLEYGKAVQETVYEQFRIVRVGKLRVVFTPDLKILTWEFCAKHHEELLSRNLVVPQVNQLVHTVQKCQSTINFTGSDWASPHDLQANCSLFLATGCQLARNIELQSVDNLGFSKRYIRCLQIAEIANSMKDLITFSLNNNIGPIESLKNYSRETSSSEPLKDESQEKGSAHCLLNNGRKLTAASPVLDSSKNDTSDITACGPVAGTEEAMLSPGYYGRLPRRNSFNPEMSKVIQEPSSSSNRACASSKSFHGPKTSKSALVQNLSVGGSSSFNSSECKQRMEEQLIRKLLQEMINNSRTTDGGEVEELNLRTTSSEVASKADYSNNAPAWFASKNAAISDMERINSFTATSRLHASGTDGSDTFIRAEQYFPEVVESMAFGYYDNRISDESGGNTSYSGKIEGMIK